MGLIIVHICECNQRRKTDTWFFSRFVVYSLPIRNTYALMFLPGADSRLVDCGLASDTRHNAKRVCRACVDVDDRYTSSAVHREKNELKRERRKHQQLWKNENMRAAANCAHNIICTRQMLGSVGHRKRKMMECFARTRRANVNNVKSTVLKNPVARESHCEFWHMVQNVTGPPVLVSISIPNGERRAERRKTLRM